MKSSKITTAKTITFATAAVAGSVSTASGFIVTGANGSEGANTDLDTLKDRHGDFNFAENVVKMGGGTGVYLGAKGNVGYLLTAGHLGNHISSVEVAGVSYATHGSELVGTGDLRLFTIGGQAGDPGLPELPSVKVAANGVNEGDDLILLGRGTRVEISDGDTSTSDMTTSSGHQVYNWGPVGDISWAENDVGLAPGWLDGGVTANWSADPNYSKQNVFFTKFDDPRSNYDDSWEGQAAGGDSGGPAFVKDRETGEYLLAGITHGVQGRYGQPGRTASFGNRTAYVNLADYADQLPEVFETSSVPETSTALLGLAGTISLVMRRSRQDDDSSQDEGNATETR